MTNLSEADGKLASGLADLLFDRHRPTGQSSLEHMQEFQHWNTVAFQAVEYVRTNESKDLPAEEPKNFEMLVIAKYENGEESRGGFAIEALLYSKKDGRGHHVVRHIVGDEKLQLLVDIIGIEELLDLKSLAERFGAATANDWRGIELTTAQYRALTGF